MRGTGAVRLLLLTMAVSGCGVAAPSLSASLSPAPASVRTPAPGSGAQSPPGSPAPLTPSGTTRVADPSASPTATVGPTKPATPVPAPTAEPVSTDPLVGQVVVTVSDNLRVRSQPRVSDDSIRYNPLLPLGTELFVLDGPAEGSGYVWYKVRPVSFGALEGPGEGWVAKAGKDGEEWIALAESQIAGLEVIRSSAARSEANPADARAAAEAINAFGAELYRTMLEDGTLDPNRNAVFSPTSIALALAMARMGAGRETAAEMDAALGLDGLPELQRGLNALDRALTSRTASWIDEDLDPALRVQELRIANGAFGQRDWPIEAAFLDAIATAFGAALRLVDFQSDAETARRAINAWVSERTRERIPELLGELDVTAATRLVLVNAIYLKAAWLDEFEADRTTPAPFTRLDGRRVTVPTMHRSWYNGLREYRVPYARGPGWEAVQLWYLPPPGAPPLAMVLIKPADLPAFERQLNEQSLADVFAALDAELQTFADGVPCPSGSDGCYPYDVELFMPRFKAETRAGVVESLRSLGIEAAMDPATADFSGISSEGPVFIKSVVHQANIDVDEKGTEAAAATVVSMDTGGGPSPLESYTLRLDRPFLFVLRDVETNAVLFMGRVVDPSEGR